MNNVVDLKTHRMQRKFDEAISRGRVPLAQSHLIPGREEDDMRLKIERIKESLERINSLMNTIKEKEKV